MWIENQEAMPRQRINVEMKKMNTNQTKPKTKAENEEKFNAKNKNNGPNVKVKHDGWRIIDKCSGMSFIKLFSVRHECDALTLAKYGTAAVTRKCIELMVENRVSSGRIAKHFFFLFHAHV